jgi:glycosyltransferase involved in cell wall biosynthesis
LFWHDHHGNRANSRKSNFIIKFISLFFSGVFTVNQELESWAKSNLYCKNVVFLPNFLPSKIVETNHTVLKGREGMRIVCLANLRQPKNHLKLLVAFNQSEAIQQGWTLHLIGKDNNDEYSNALKSYIQINELDEKVLLYGSCTDTNFILKQANIGVLVSTFEGFPVTLLEYGMANLGVVTTEVGYCSTLVENEVTGLIVNPNSINEISDKIDKIALDKNFRNDLSLKFNTFVSENYSANKIIDLILPFYIK